MNSRFDLKALHAALDEQRQARGLTWAQAMREIGVVGVTAVRPISASTVAGLRTKALAEADGVLQMLRWLERAPESFVAGFSAADLPAARLPDADRREVLRFDTRKLFEALDAERGAKGLTWKQLGSETGVSESHLRTLAKGGRTAFPAVTQLTAWLKLPAATFVRRAPF